MAGRDGLLRVSGRLRHSATPYEEKHPIVLSSHSIIATRYAQHVHETIPHQGRKITQSSIRKNGVFIVGGRRIVNQIIARCVQCKRLRGATCEQLMADLPTERLEATAPFTHVGVDVFGHFFIRQGKATRGGPREF